jgi:hypothetical protein
MQLSFQHYVWYGRRVVIELFYGFGGILWRLLVLAVVAIPADAFPVERVPIKAVRPRVCNSCTNLRYAPSGL